MKNHITINILLVIGTLLLIGGSIYLVPTIFSTALFALLLYFLSRLKLVRVVSINLLILFISLFAIEAFLKSAASYKNIKKK